MAKIGAEMTKSLQKSFPHCRFCLLDQDIVEQAPSPAKYSRGRLFTMVFAEVL
jgi:hypothetical protein